MSHPHTYPRGARYYLLRPEYLETCQAVLRHPGCTFAQLRVFTKFSRPQLQSYLRALENTGIINKIKVQHPARYCIYTLNPAHVPALISDFGITA